jgi:metal-dependent hydrolase (beta-lactamase superfamily II)
MTDATAFAGSRGERQQEFITRDSSDGLSLIPEAVPGQALVLKTAVGLIVITGCAHPGW